MTTKNTSTDRPEEGREVVATKEATTRVVTTMKKSPPIRRITNRTCMKRSATTSILRTTRIKKRFLMLVEAEGDLSDQPEEASQE